MTIVAGEPPKQNQGQTDPPLAIRSDVPVPPVADTHTQQAVADAAAIDRAYDK